MVLLRVQLVLVMNFIMAETTDEKFTLANGIWTLKHASS